MDMKWVSVLLLVLLVLGTIFVPTNVVASDEGGTVIDHDIEGEVVWTKEGSPYIIQGDITIRGALVVEPGVVIRQVLGSITLEGKLVINGTPEEPVVLEAEDIPMTWELIAVEGSEVYMNYVYLDVPLVMQLLNAKAEITNVWGTAVDIMETVGSDILIENVTVCGITFIPPVFGRVIDIVNGEGVFIVQDKAVRESNIVIRNAFVKGEIGQCSNGGFAPYIEETSLIMENVTALLGIHVSANMSNIKMDKVSTTEMLLQMLYDTDVTITDSVVMNGRGIFIEEFRNILRDKVTFTMHRTTFYNITKTSIYDIAPKALEVVRSGRNAHFDISYNYWDDAVYEIWDLEDNPSENVTDKPKLVEPTIDILENLEVEVEPPIPIVGATIEIKVYPELENAYYMMLYTIGASTTKHFMETTSGTFALEVEDDVHGTIYVYHSRAIYKLNLDIVAVSIGEVEVYYLRIIPEPIDGVITNTNTVMFETAIGVPTQEIIPYLKVVLRLTSAWGESKDYVMERVGENGYRLNLTLNDGYYYAEVYVNYTSVTVGQSYSIEEFIIDADPPTINATALRIAEDKAMVNITVWNAGVEIERFAIYYKDEEILNGTLWDIEYRSKERVPEYSMSTFTGWNTYNITMTLFIKIDEPGEIRIAAEDALGRVAEKVVEIPEEVTPITTTTTTTTTTPSTETITIPVETPSTATATTESPPTIPMSTETTTTTSIPSTTTITTIPPAETETITETTPATPATEAAATATETETALPTITEKLTMSPTETSLSSPIISPTPSLTSTVTPTTT
ncbi:MAG: hypothetical protein J7L51_02640, partial [Desulfurococcales archaeon]|nr:hypothetical protein [Desulfurococcales archaeon]